MVSTAIVHIIGTVSLIVILTIITIYVSSMTYITMINDEKKNLRKIVDSLTLQIMYMLEIDTNISMRLQYPVEAISGHRYNIYLGSGAALSDIIQEQLQPNAIYILAKDPASGIYVYSFLIWNSTSKPIIIENNPVVFGSTTATVLRKTITLSYIILRVEIIEVVAR